MLRSPSPLAAKGLRNQKLTSKPASGSKEYYASGSREDEESEEISSITETDDEYHEDEEESEIEDWSAEEATQPPQTKNASQSSKAKPKSQPKATGTSRSSKDQVAQLVKQTKGLSIDEDTGSDDSAAVLPQRKAKTSASSAVSRSIQSEDVKKKKR